MQERILSIPSQTDIEPTKRSFTRIGTWEIDTLNVEKTLPKDIERQAIEIVKKWTEVFPKEPTWIQENFGIPSLLVRIDGVDRNGRLGVYEVEDRPAGIGLSILINPQFAEKLAKLKQTWQDFDVVMSPKRKDGDVADDKLWSNVVDMNLAKGLVYVRAEPEEEEFRTLQSRSVSTITTEGIKSYGVGLGLWTFVNNPNQLSEDESFVLKSLQNSKGRDMIFHDKDKRPGHIRFKSVKKSFEKQVEEKGGMYLQKLIPPMDSGVASHPFMIYRFLIGFDMSKREWISLGGLWFARNNLKIHGASDSLSGPLITV